jgi:hypothetical protein
MGSYTTRISFKLVFVAMAMVIILIPSNRSPHHLHHLKVTQNLLISGLITINKTQLSAIQ